MTKHIRIENADTSDHKVMVEEWDKVTDGPDVLVSSYELNYPTAMAELTIWDNRYLVIKEI